MHTPHKTWIFYFGKDQALLMPMNLCPVDLVGACWANGQRRRIVQLESILNVSQLAIRAPASPGSTAAILLFSLSLSLRLSSPPPAPQPHLTREERHTISNFQWFAYGWTTWLDLYPMVCHCKTYQEPAMNRSLSFSATKARNSVIYSVITRNCHTSFLSNQNRTIPL